MKIMKESATDKTKHINQRHNYLIKIQNYFYFTFSYSLTHVIIVVKGLHVSHAVRPQYYRNQLNQINAISEAREGNPITRG